LLAPKHVVGCARREDWVIGIDAPTPVHLDEMSDAIADLQGRVKLLEDPLLHRVLSLLGSCALRGGGRGERHEHEGRKPSAHDILPPLQFPYCIEACPVLGLC
jgi:hypothetical protein